MSLSTGTLLGANAFFLYLFVYVVTMFVFFCILVSFKTDARQNATYITDLLYTKTVHPITKLAITTLFFSMAGIPPLIGFFAKFYIFFAAIESSYYLLLVISILCSTLSAFYYIRIIKIVNFETALNLRTATFKPTIMGYSYIIVGLLFIIFFFIIPNFFITKTYYLGLLLT
jgi:NADH-quinone oxidoreductase subunit N